MVVQRPGEVLFVPAGWWHVVLNVEASTAVSHALTLSRDLPWLLTVRSRGQGLVCVPREGREPGHCRA